MANITLIVGSAPDAIDVEGWDKSLFTNIVVINNAWQLEIDWDYLIYADDFPHKKRPKNIAATQKIVQSQTYVPILNQYGGCVYQGATMAFSSGYWALGALKPDVLLFKGCDMIYAANGSTHFYGRGAADPLRNDLTLQSLSAKSNRLLHFSAQQNCVCFNLSELPESALTFVRAKLSDLKKLEYKLPEIKNAKAALAAEKKLGYYVESGKYWEMLEKFSEQELKKIDDLWDAG